MNDVRFIIYFGITTIQTYNDLKITYLLTIPFLIWHIRE